MGASLTPILWSNWQSLAKDLVLTGAEQNRDVMVEPGAKLLYAAALPPYVAGTTMRGEKMPPFDPSARSLKGAWRHGILPLN
jgi:hypothetical protein